ncbi:MAG: phosphodiester glycosidase family protein, partial [Deltaproteobacteria bacterium]
GWYPTTVTTQVPRGTVALVSGFPELIVEGQRVTCSSPTASSCFPDRTDMRARNPRTAMGLTRDRRTFILLTVDGRSTASAGMYGTEEARLMELLGAWEAMNVDGGGSTTMWQQGRGVLNVPSDPVERVVYNHWGVFAGAADGQARATGHCFTAGGCFPTRVEGAEALTFKDVLPTSAGAREIGAVFNAHLDNGCQTTPERFFCPNCRVTRRAMLHMLVLGLRLNTTTPPARATFTDVPTTDAMFAEIEAAVRAGWIDGCGAGNFCPGGAITRAQGAALIRRALGWSLARPTTPSFGDVPATDANYGDIEAIKTRCISGGCGSGNYCPARYMVRWEAASFVARALDLENVNACITTAPDGGMPVFDAGIDPGVDASDPDDASIDLDADTLDDVPDFVNDASRGEMPPATEEGCGCRVESLGHARSRALPGGLIALAAVLGAMGVARRRPRTHAPVTQ